MQASASVLITLSRALRLDDDQQAYLYELAGKAPRPRHRPAQKIRPAMRRLIDQLTDTSALVLGRRLDILDWNAAATPLYTDFARIPARRRNYMRLLFTDPVVRALHTEWDHDAHRPRVAPNGGRKRPGRPRNSPSWSVSCRCRMPTSAPGGPRIRSPGRDTTPSTTGIRSSVTSPSTATPGTAGRRFPARPDAPACPATQVTI